MSCNGCRVLRKGCSESCILRPCLQRIESAEAQGHATVFVAKFFGRAGLMSFISSVPEIQRPALFQSLLFEACGRTVNPVNGAVGLLWTGNWHVCQAAVETVLRGGTLRPLSEIPIGMPESDEEVTCTDKMMQNLNRDPYARSRSLKRKAPEALRLPDCDLDLCLMSGFLANPSPEETTTKTPARSEKRRPGTPSMISEGSVTTSIESGGDQGSGDRKLLNLFV
ncbi:LOB domain-containing protein 39-like [Tasmannia lanceolata]|uniref:LOB domain-containing protein 39-like n=1 Tax=Tasmannia lanceolata TaxID=3420 RepID=UPI00406357CC